MSPLRLAPRPLALPPLALVASLALAVAATFALALVAVAPAQAEIVHEYLGPLSAGYAKTVPPGSEVNALTFDSGDLWLAEQQLTSGHVTGTQVDEFLGSSAAVVKPALVPEHGLSAFAGEGGVAVGHGPVLGEEDVYVPAEESAGELRKNVVGVYAGASGKWLASWSGVSTPTGSFTETEVAGAQKSVAFIKGVAVDDTPEPAPDPARGDVYVATDSVREFGQPPAFPAFDAVDVLAPAAGGAEPGAGGVHQITGTCKNPGELATGPLACPLSKVVPFLNPDKVAVSSFNSDVLVEDELGECEHGDEIPGCVVDVFAPGESPGSYEFMFQITETHEGDLLDRIEAIAVDAHNGDIYLLESHAVDEFSATGVFLGRIAGTPEGPFGLDQSGGHVASVAVDPEAPSNNDVFVGEVTEHEHGRIDAYGPDRIAPDVKVGEATTVTPEGATLNGTVNLAEGGPATCVFEYGVGGYEHTVDCEPHEVVGEEEAVSAKVPGLTPDTVYQFRVAARNNEDGLTNNGEGVKQDEGVFQTTGPAMKASASDVGATSATLDASVDPDRAPTSVYFQYGMTTAYEDGSVPAPPGEALGQTKGFVAAKGQHVQGLAPGREYHYRVLASSVLEVEGKTETRTFEGPDQTFTTQGASTSIGLPDGRQYQLVSPPDKQGALISPIGSGRVTQASADGQAITYAAETPTESEPAGNANAAQVLSTRGGGGPAGTASPGGWGSRDIATPHAIPVGNNVTSQEYRFFSEDLSLAVVQPQGAFLALSPHASEQTAYERTDFPEGSPGSNCTSECYTPLVSGCPPAGQACEAPIAEYADVPAGTIFGLGDKEKGPVSCPPELECGPHFEGASSDGADVVIDSREPLTQEAAGSVGAQLYEWSASSAPAGRLTLVSILPPTTEEEAKGEHGRPPMSAALGEPDEGVVRDTVSADGSRVVWQVPGGGHLYLRDVALRQTVQLDAVREGKGQGKAEPMYQAASVDGSRIYFTDKQRLTGNAGGEGEAFREGDLYECEVVVSPGGKLDCKLTDLTPESASGEHARVQGLVIGTSKDGSYVYFVADGVLSDHGAPVAGAQPGGCHSGASAGALCNLYVWHEGTLGLVARISMEDAPDWNPDGGHGLAEVAAGLSPDGRWLAFMSDRSLTGYDMRDLRLGVADEEVFAYHAPADLATEAGRISCLSCNPTGARPVGKEFDQMIPGIDGETGMWAPSRVLAGSLPGWESYNSGNPPATLHKPRLVSDNGRVFFNTNDALAPADVNRTGDVYEFEPGGVPAGEHTCSNSSTTASDVYKPAHTVEVEGRSVEEGAGCVALISSGASPDESGFLDASATGGRTEENGESVEGGGDVFFFTDSQLVPEDRDTSRDVYDAHECPNAQNPVAVPCPPTPAATPPPCESESACTPAPSPQPSIFGAGPTETFKGPGNIAPPPAGKPKVETRAEKLKAALASCKHKYSHSKKKRSTCEKKARKAYAAKHAAKKSSRKKN